jgi:hypothetical protein
MAVAAAWCLLITAIERGMKNGMLCILDVATANFAGCNSVGWQGETAGMRCLTMPRQGARMKSLVELRTQL